MAATATNRSPHVTIHLDDAEPPAAHRLPELLQALTGCSVADAEFAVGDPMPQGPIASDDALAVLAAAMVRLRRAAAANAADEGQGASYEGPTADAPPPAPDPDRSTSSS